MLIRYPMVVNCTRDEFLTSSCEPDRVRIWNAIKNGVEFECEFDQNKNIMKIFVDGHEVVCNTTPILRNTDIHYFKPQIEKWLTGYQRLGRMISEFSK